MSRQIVIFALDGIQPLDVVGPYEVFAGAEEAAARLGRSGVSYDVRVVSPGGRRIRSESALVLQAHAPAEALLGRRASAIDTLIVAGGRGARLAVNDRKVVALVRKLGRRPRRVASVCTGAYLLGAAGLLDNRRATTHWGYCADLAAAFPSTRVDPDPIFVRDGRIWTSAGVTAGIDLALAMVEEDFGREVAALVARGMVVFVRRAGGQSQFSAQLAAQTAEREPIRALQAFIVEHPEAPLDVPRLAKRAGMSPRHFSRVFRAEIGHPPAAFVEKVRVETARRLLETTSLPVEAVAATAGFGTPESLRRAFARGVSLSPREYRARFGNPPRGATP